VKAAGFFVTLFFAPFNNVVEDVFEAGGRMNSGDGIFECFDTTVRSIPRATERGYLICNIWWKQRSKISIRFTSQ